MKNIMLTLAGSMVFGLTSLLAQNTDQTQNSNSTNQQNTNQQSTQGQQQQGVYAQPPVQQQPQIDRQQQPQLNQQQQANPTQTTPQPAVPQQQTYPDPQDRYQSPYPNRNQTMVQPNELPSAMQQTLQGQQYRGWENSAIYRDRTTGEYSLQLREGNETPRIYRFDRNGRVIDEANKPTQSIRGPEGVKDIDQ